MTKQLEAMKEAVRRAPLDNPVGLSQGWQDYFNAVTPLHVAHLIAALEQAQAQSSKWLEAYHKAVSIGARYEERIAELEASPVAVKLPTRKTAADYVDGEYTNEDLADIYNCCRLECSVRIKNAGGTVDEGSS